VAVQLRASLNSQGYAHRSLRPAAGGLCLAAGTQDRNPQCARIRSRRRARARGLAQPVNSGPLQTASAQSERQWYEQSACREDRGFRRRPRRGVGADADTNGGKAPALGKSIGCQTWCLVRNFPRWNTLR
jgi:hypothetical protein